MMQSRFLFIPFVFILFSVFVSCGAEDPFSIPPPDLSTVPEPFDTSNVESIELEKGVRAYIHEEGFGPFEVTPRDRVPLFLTLRTDEGEVIYSTFANSRTNPVPVTMTIAGEIQPVFDFTIEMAYTPGFKIGLLGMKTGERRTLVVPPEQGFLDVPEGHFNETFRNNSLIYDIRVSSIGPSKSQ